jgi:hypothetical protein
MAETYWAAYPPEKLAPEIMSRWKDWRRYFWQSGIGEKADKGRRYYYGWNNLGEASSRVQVGGDKGQYLKAVINKIRPVVQRARAMISAQAPKMAPIAANSDAGARKQAISSKGVLEHVHRELDTDAIDDEVLEIAMTMGEGFRLTLWDATLGEEQAVDPDTGRPETAGDIKTQALTPFDVAKDPSIRTWRNVPWVIVRTFESRWELAAQHHEKADRILAARDHEPEVGDGFDMRLGVTDLINQGDFIPVYTFVHVDGKALKDGRYFRCLNEGTWLEDSANPYKTSAGRSRLPIESCAPDRIIATSMGYANIFDALGVADLLNAMESVIASHTVRWGVRPIIDYQGSGLQHSTLGNGVTVLTVKSKEYTPEPMDVPPIPPEVFKHLEALAEEIYQLLGMNSTAAGEPPFSGMAAQAMLLLDQKAREFNDGLARSFSSYKRGCASLELSILQNFAHTPRIAAIEGKAQQWMLKSWTSADLKQVREVAMEPVPAGTGTMAWKWAMAELLQKFGVQMPPADIVNLMRTGEYESPFEYEEANRLRIKSECEGLLEGRMPPLLMARTHWLDIPEHLALLAPPGVEEKPEVVKAVLATVDAKLAMWRSMPPDLLALLGGPPAPSTVPVLPPGTVAPGTQPQQSPQQPQAPEGAA